MATRQPSKKQILKIAMMLAEARSWEAVHLHDIAMALQITLPQLHQSIRDKDDLVIAWFDIAENAMLKATQDQDFEHMNTKDKLRHLIFVWLDKLGEHKAVTKQMIGSQIEPGHIQILPAVTQRLRRTAQWLQEAAKMEEGLVKRLAQEAGISSILLSTFICWLLDDSDDSEKTNAFLGQALTMAEQSSYLFEAISSRLGNPSWLGYRSTLRH